MGGLGPFLSIDFYLGGHAKDDQRVDQDFKLGPLVLPLLVYPPTHETNYLKLSKIPFWQRSSHIGPEVDQQHATN